MLSHPPSKDESKTPEQACASALKELLATNNPQTTSLNRRLKEIRALENQTSFTLLLQATLYYQLNKYNESKKICQTIIHDASVSLEISHNVAYSWLVLARCHYRDQEVTDALRCFSTGIEMNSRLSNTASSELEPLFQPLELAKEIRQVLSECYPNDTISLQAGASTDIPSNLCTDYANQALKHKNIPSKMITYLNVAIWLLTTKLNTADPKRLKLFYLLRRDQHLKDFEYSNCYHDHASLIHLEHSSEEKKKMNTQFIDAIRQNMPHKSSSHFRKMVAQCVYDAKEDNNSSANNLVDLIKQIEKQHKLDPFLLYSMVLACYQKGDFDNAIEYCRQYLELNKGYSEEHIAILFYKARSYFQKNDYKTAMNSFIYAMDISSICETYTLPLSQVEQVVDEFSVCIEKTKNQDFFNHPLIEKLMALDLFQTRPLFKNVGQEQKQDTESLGMLLMTLCFATWLVSSFNKDKRHDATLLNYSIVRRNNFLKNRQYRLSLFDHEKMLTLYCHTNDEKEKCNIEFSNQLADLAKEKQDNLQYSQAIELYQYAYQTYASKTILTNLKSCELRFISQQVYNIEKEESPRRTTQKAKNKTKQKSDYIELTDTTKTVMAELKNSGLPVRVIGGFIRDSLNNEETSDIDLVTSSLTDDLIKGLSFKNHLVKSPHIKNLFYLSINDEKFDIYSLPCFSGDALNEDAMCRDFTMNALYADEDGKVDDPTKKGYKDIEEKRIETITEAKESFAEDPIRILRAIYFASKLNFGLSENVRQAACLCAERLLDPEKVSASRVNAWLQKLFSQKEAAMNFKLLIELGIFETLFPETKELLKQHGQQFEKIIDSESKQQKPPKKRLESIYDQILMIVAKETKLDTVGLIQGNALFKSFYDSSKPRLSGNNASLFAKSSSSSSSSSPSPANYSCVNNPGT